MSKSGLVVPMECLKFIRWQRARFIMAKMPDPHKVLAGYAEWVEEDYSIIEPHLPEHVESILEIGCGLGALQALIKRRYPDAHLSLLDGDGDNTDLTGTPNEVGGGGYRQVMKPYNSRAHTEMLLAANGVKVDRWIDVGTKEHLKADLILSTYSWGFHYPLNTYDVEGFVICDLRRNVLANADQIAKSKIIFRGPKYDRCAFTLGR